MTSPPISGAGGVTEAARAERFPSPGRILRRGPSGVRGPRGARFGPLVYLMTWWLRRCSFDMDSF